MGFVNIFAWSLKPSLHIVVMVVSTVANMFLTLFQAVLIHVNTSCIANLKQRDMAKQLLTPLRLIARMNFSLKNYSCGLLLLG